jgi:hypothetical protein
MSEPVGSAGVTVATGFSGVPGLPCPGCGRRIVIAMEQLLSMQPIRCACGIELHVDAAQSKETLDDLRTLHDRLQNLRGQA